MKHFLESRLVDYCLSRLPEKSRNEYRLKLAHDANNGAWCFIDMRRMQKIYEEKGLVKVTTLGNAKLLSIRTRPLVDVGLEELMKAPDEWSGSKFAEWYLQGREIREKLPAALYKAKRS